MLKMKPESEPAATSPPMTINCTMRSRKLSRPRIVTRRMAWPWLDNQARPLTVPTTGVILAV